MRQCEARQSASCFKTAWQDVDNCERDQFCGVFARGVGGTGPANVNVHSAPDFPTRPTVMSTPICRTRSPCCARAAERITSLSSSTLFALSSGVKKLCPD
jgi:hypothetical protein